MLAERGMVVQVTPLSVRRYDNVNVEVYANSKELGIAAARRTAEVTAQHLAAADHINMLFSTGASQFDFVAALQGEAIDWKRVHGFHLDEWLGLSPEHPASFHLWLKTRVVTPLKPGAFEHINGQPADAEAECKRYEELLKKNPIDLGFVGIGENGHIAFNDPPADFNDKRWVKIVEPDYKCRMQQVGEGWFATVDDVPGNALSMTVPAILSSKKIFSIVPDKRKAEAMRQALLGPVDENCPASILRTHPDVTIFLETDSASLLD